MAEIGKASQPAGGGEPPNWLEIHAWVAYHQGTVSAAWRPLTLQFVDPSMLCIGSMGGAGGSLPSNKTIAIFRMVLIHITYSCDSPSVRLYNDTKATAIATITDASGENTYSQSEGNPLSSYDYAANDVVFAQERYTSGTSNKSLAGLFEARVY